MIKDSPEKPKTTLNKRGGKPHLLNLKGITLIEMVAVIVVLGIAIPPLLNNWADIAWRSARTETIIDASFYTQELLEEIKAKNFDENFLSRTPSTQFSSTEPGENKADSSTFDDADDFVGCLDPAVTIPAAGYSRSVSVDYVRLSGANWISCGPVDNCGGTLCDTQCTACCYKKITVTVSRNDNLLTNASSSAIMSAY